MLWFNFILRSNFIFFRFKLIIILLSYIFIPKKQKNTKFEPRIKLNHNMYYVALHQQFQVKLPHLQSAWHQEETLQYLENNREIMNPDYSDSRIEEKEPQFYPKYCIN